MHTMGDVARCSVNNEELLYKLFGKNAELIIDHAWGYEPCTIEDVKNYKPTRNSIGSGQVLHCAYNYEKTKLIIKEMADLLSLDLVKKNLVTDQLVLTIGYDIENLTDPLISKKYNGPITTDHYGRDIPKPAHGTINIDHKTSSTKVIVEYAVKLYERITNPNLLIKRINITANNVITMEKAKNSHTYKQIDIFTNYEELVKEKEEVEKTENDENVLQHVLLDIKNKYGKNAILKGMNLEEGGTTIERNEQIGGHRG